MSERVEPAPTHAFRVADQSNRRWAYGFIRMAPFLMYVAGICMLLLLFRVEPELGAIGLLLAPVFFLGPLILDRSALLDPVDYVNFSEHMMVKRLVKQRSHPPERIIQIEFTAPPGEDYDDELAGRRFKALTIRIAGHWPAKLLVTHDDARAIRDWARANRVRLVEPRDTR